MRAMSEAIEGARDFRGMMDKIEAGAAQQANAMRLHQAATQGDATAERRCSAMPDGEPCGLPPGCPDCGRCLVDADLEP